MDNPETLAILDTEDRNEDKQRGKQTHARTHVMWAGESLDSPISNNIAILK